MPLASGHESTEGACEGVPSAELLSAGARRRRREVGCPHLRGATAGQSNGQEGQRLRALGPARSWS